jgi:hypothetical protein
MALHWNITDCNNYETLQVEETGEWSITNGLIWGTLAADMGQITKSNVAEFYARIKVWELVTGSLLTRHNQETDTWEGYFITFADIQKRIGLTTNVSTVTITNWFKRIDRIMETSSYYEKVTKNKIKAVYYSALAEVEEYTSSTKETVNA